MAFTGEDVRRMAEEYREEARREDRKQFLQYIAWLRSNREYIKRSSQYELSPRS